jgi:hypothetical protein
VVSEDGTGRRLTVSHFNKAYKGQLAAVLAKAQREPSSVRAVIRVASAAGLRLDQTGPRSLDLVVR